MSPEVDIGQVEGAYIMGMGFWLKERLVYDENTGELLTKNTWVAVILILSESDLLWKSNLLRPFCLHSIRSTKYRFLNAFLRTSGSNLSATDQILWVYLDPKVLQTLWHTDCYKALIAKQLRKNFKFVASGEAPICLTITIVLALRNAIAAARKDAGQTGWFRMGKSTTMNCNVGNTEHGFDFEFFIFSRFPVTS